MEDTGTSQIQVKQVFPLGIPLVLERPRADLGTSRRDSETSAGDKPRQASCFFVLCFLLFYVVCFVAKSLEKPRARRGARRSDSCNWRPGRQRQPQLLTKRPLAQHPIHAHTIHAETSAATSQRQVAHKHVWREPPTIDC